MQRTTVVDTAVNRKPFGRAVITAIHGAPVFAWIVAAALAAAPGCAEEAVKKPDDPKPLPDASSLERGSSGPTLQPADGTANGQ